MLLTHVIVPLGKLIHLKGLQNTWRLIDDYHYTKVLSKTISHTVHWLGSFVEGKNSNKLEKLQERALRIVFDDFSTSYEIMCERANTLPLSFYRLCFLALQMYECVNVFNPTYLNDLFTAQSNDYHLRDSSRLIQPKFNTFKFGFKSFRYFGAKLWNVLPINIKRFESLSIFKRSITAWCHSDAAKALERKIFWSIYFCILSLHSLINVADRHFRPFCSFIMCHFLILFLCLYKGGFNMVSFMSI